jgi:hypothetical protein
LNCGPEPDGTGLSEFGLVVGLRGFLGVLFNSFVSDFTQFPALFSVEGYGQRQAPSLKVLPPVHPCVPPQAPVWRSRALQHDPSALRGALKGQPVVTGPQLGPWQPGSTKKHWPLRPILVPSGQVTVIVGGGGGGRGDGGGVARHWPTPAGTSCVMQEISGPGGPEVLGERPGIETQFLNFAPGL